MGAIIDALMYILAGAGATHLVDKFAPDKVPGYPAGGISPKNFLWFAGVATLAIVAIKFIAKKFHIKILK
jgi:hypothetical protein